MAETNLKDAFGHAQLGGVAPYLSSLINKELKLKNHWAVSDYLQRSARHISSKTIQMMRFVVLKIRLKNYKVI